MNGGLMLWLDPPKRDFADKRWVGQEYYYPSLVLPWDIFPEVGWTTEPKEVLMTLETKEKK